MSISLESSCRHEKLNCYLITKSLKKHKLFTEIVDYLCAKNRKWPNI